MKLNKKWIAVLLLVVMALCLTACGEKKEEAKPTEAPKPTIVGKWQMDIKSVLKMSGISEAEYEQMKPLIGDMSATMEFTEDGKVYLVVTAMGQSETEEEAYSVDGDKLTMSGSTGTYKIDGDKLTITQDGMSLTMTRVK